jgi:hypothetical protein
MLVSIQMMFRYIGGKCRIASVPALVKAESVFHPNVKLTCITTTVTSERQTIQQIKWLPVVASTEADWLSLLEAIRYSMTNSEKHIHIENNNEQVVQSLFAKKRKIDKYRSYKHAVLALANQTDWTGIRWAPNSELVHSSEKQ